MAQVQKVEEKKVVHHEDAPVVESPKLTNVVEAYEEVDIFVKAKNKLDAKMFLELHVLRMGIDKLVSLNSIGAGYRAKVERFLGREER